MNIITTTQDLTTFCQSAATFEFLAIDTEFMRESTFYSKLCLIQAATSDDEVIIDPLADGIDLTPLCQILTNPDVVKVLHSARQDLEIFYRLCGAVPEPLFDTQVAAMALGYGDSIGYGNLVKGRLGRHVDKGARFTDWSRRPLENRQLEYALADVTHLRDLYPGLRADLKSQKRLSWVMEEMGSLLDESLYTFEPEEAWQRIKLRKFSSDYLAALRAAAAWREDQAKTRDVPRSRILKDDGIQDIANNKPQSEKALARLRSIPKGFERSRAGQALLEKLRDALADAESYAPEVKRPKAVPSSLTPAIDMLKTLLRQASEAHNLAPKMIATTQDLEDLAVNRDNGTTPVLKGWRREVFGQQALDLLSGRLSLRIADGKVVAERTAD